jgi:hypothetical protein
VATLAAGGAVAVWESEVPGAGGSSLVARRIDAAGAVVGPELEVVSADDGWNRSPVLASTNSGGAVLVWRLGPRSWPTGPEHLLAALLDPDAALEGERYILEHKETEHVVEVLLARNAKTNALQPGSWFFSTGDLFNPGEALLFMHRVTTVDPQGDAMLLKLEALNPHDIVTLLGSATFNLTIDESSTMQEIFEELPLID